MDEKLVFQCGTDPIFVQDILVRRTYAGVLLGRPNQRMNRGLQDYFVRQASEYFSFEHAYVFDPHRGTMDGSSERLPGYACAVHLMHTSPVHDLRRAMSRALIIWYQEGNPLISGATIVQTLQRFSWAQVAQDGDW